MTLEFWVVRVLMHRGPAKGPMMLSEEGRKELPAAVLSKVVAGELACIPPDYVIAEPVDGPHPAEVEAAAAREKYASDDPGGDYRVILNTEGV